MYTDVNNLYEDLLNYGVGASPRGRKTRELLGPTLMVEPWAWFINHRLMPLNYKYVRTELEWYMNGRLEDLSICDHASTWKDCVTDGRLNSNYGYYFLDQVAHVVTLLSRDPDSRRAVININRPEHNYMSNKDVPCTMYMNFMIRDGQVHSFVRMRSQDAYYGLRNDIPAFQMFKLHVATMLQLPPGNLYLSADSFHIYEDKLARVADALSDKTPIQMWCTIFHDWVTFMQWIDGTLGHED
jgi:thymidylate synthase